MRPMMRVMLSASTGLPGPHRYWRVFVTTNGGAANIAVVELEMYTARFGANRCAGGTASASSAVSGLSASEAFDNSLRDSGTNTTTQDLWAATSGSNEWLAYDFGAGNAYQIVELGMWGRQSVNVNQMPTAFRVEYSDDASTWKTAWSVSGQTWSANEFKRFTHPLAAARVGTGSPFGSHVYWRLESPTTSNGASVTSIAEAEMRATPGGSDQCTGGTATASSTFSTQVASLGFDNSGATYWASNELYGWLRYQFASAVSVAEVTMTSRNDASWAQIPGVIGVRYSDDGTTWTTAFRGAGASWAQGVTRTFTDPNYI